MIIYPHDRRVMSAKSLEGIFRSEKEIAKKLQILQAVQQYREEEAGIIMIGKTVTVTVDRAMGTYHPEHPDMYYPINYGYIKGIIAPDGEEQDVYILGVDKPVKEFTGKITAVIRRNNDIEEKWVVVPQNAHYTKEEIIEETCFQEQYFDSYVIM